MFAVFILALITTQITAHVTRDIPSYIKVCGRKDPKLDECIMDSVSKLRQKICEGIPEMEVPPIDPIKLDDIVIANTDDAKLYLRDTDLIGLCNYIVDHIHADLDKLHFNVKVSFDRLNLNSTYDFNIRVLVPIAINGKTFIVGDKINANFNMDMKTVTKDGKKYVYISKAILDIDIKVFNFTFTNTDNEKTDLLQKIINNFIGTNQEEVYKTSKPALEEALCKTIIRHSNNLLKHFTYDELFPDRM